MKKNLIIILFFLTNFIYANNLQLTDEENKYLQNNNIKIAVTKDYYPFSFYNEKGELMGFSIDYINIISTILNKKIDIEVDNWSENLSKFESGKINLIDQISYKKEREKFTNFTKAYYEIPNVIFARKNEFSNYKNMYDLKGKKVGITKDIYYLNDIKKLRIFDIVLFESSRDKLKALAYGKIDACINNLISGQEYIKQGGYSNIKVLEEVDESIIKREDLRIGINKSDETLFSIMKKATDTITQNQIDEIYNRWFGIGEIDEKTQKLDLKDNQLDSNEVYDFSLIFKITLIILFIIFIFIFRQNYMKKQNKRLRDLNEKLVTENQERINAQSRLQIAIKELDNLAKIDQLTNLFNRRELDNILKNQCNLKNRLALEFSIILFDVDFFKAYNDHYGHLQGDECLKHVAKILLDEIDLKKDFAARYGGEEFVLVITNSTLEQAAKIANSIKIKLAKSKFPHIKSSISSFLTLSAGISNSYEFNECSYENILNLADNRLYYSKQNGRDTITFK